jgi:anti-sigma regulatory factor (Ser/Thr protein kinase)
MCDATPEAAVDLPSSVHAPSLARDFVQEHICRRHGDSAESAVKLVTSELVTNAVLYGAPPISVTVACAVHEIRVSVADGNTEMPVLPGPQEGLGLLLVEKISKEWGTSVVPDGKVVWCAIPTGMVPESRPGTGNGHDERSQYYRRLYRTLRDI